MELPDREQRELDEIEQRLAEDDPKLAARLSSSVPRMFVLSRRTSTVIGVLAAYLVGLVAMILGVTVTSPILVGLGACAVAGVFIGMVVRAWRARNR